MIEFILLIATGFLIYCVVKERLDNIGIGCCVAERRIGKDRRKASRSIYDRRKRTHENTSNK